MPSELEARVMRKISFRIVPFIMLLYFIAFIDRVNIGFAALTMNKDLGFSPAVFGLGAGIFFLGYFLFEVPSNLILNKVGARLWIARVMITWGIISAAFAFIREKQVSSSCAFCSASRRPASSPGSSCISAFGSRRDTAPESFRCLWPRRQSRSFLARRFPAHCWRWTDCLASGAGSGCSLWRPFRQFFLVLSSWLHDGQAGEGDMAEG